MLPQAAFSFFYKFFQMSLEWIKILVLLLKLFMVNRIVNNLFYASRLKMFFNWSMLFRQLIRWAVMSQRDWFAAVILISSAGIFSGNSFRAKSTGLPGCIIAALKGWKIVEFSKSFWLLRVRGRLVGIIDMFFAFESGLILGRF